MLIQNTIRNKNIAINFYKPNSTTTTTSQTLYNNFEISNSSTFPFTITDFKNQQLLPIRKTIKKTNHIYNFLNILNSKRTLLILNNLSNELFNLLKFFNSYPTHKPQKNQLSLTSESKSSQTHFQQKKI